MFEEAGTVRGKRPMLARCWSKATIIAAVIIS